MSSFIVWESRQYEGLLRQLAKAYGRLPTSLAKKHVKAAVGRAAKPFLPEVRKAAPKGKTGNLKRSAGVKVFFGKRDASGSWVAKVGYRRGKAKSAKGQHALIVNDGTKPRQTKAGANRGKGPATRFFDSTLASIRSRGLAGLETQLLAALEKAEKELPRYLKNRRR